MQNWLTKTKRICENCFSEYMPTGIRQRFCEICGLENKRLMDRKYKHSKKYIEYRKKYDRSDIGQAKYKRFRSSELYKKKSKKRYHLTDENVRKAHYTVSNAIRDGRLKRPKNCEKCGIKDWGIKRSMIESHHYLGYQPENWLIVKWLCTNCHKEVSRY